MKTSRVLLCAPLAGALLLGVPAGAAIAAETVLYSFAGGTDGFEPQSDLIADKAGNLYGTTLYGGAAGVSGNGTVFELSPNGGGWTEQVIYAFQGGTDGNGPVGGLAMYKGHLYGTTQGGGTGAISSGTVFELKPPKTQGKPWKKTTLYSFCSQANCTDGATPYAGVTLDANGVIYGTTLLGGNGAFQANGGTVYALNPPVNKGGTWTETVLHNFCDQVNCADGWQPQAARLLLFNGNLYGTASKSDNAGTLYEVAPNGNAFTVLHDFSLSNGDGRGPFAGVVADKNGVLYGTTVSDSVNSCGTVYSYGSGSYRQLYVFCPNGNHADGVYPLAGVTLALGTNGSPSAIYGTTQQGGASNAGVVFKLSGKVLHSFCAEPNCTDGAGPLYGSLLRHNGAYYGTTPLGGASNNGVIYSVTK